MMGLAHILALGVFVSYFALIFVLFTIIFRSISPGCRTTSAGKIWGFWFLTLGSLIHTQFYVFKFVVRSFNDYMSLNSTMTTAPVFEQLTSWLLNAPLYDEASTGVYFGPMSWWWNEQMDIYTVVWTLFLVVLGHSNNIKYVWAYPLLGHLVARSVASNLFYLTLISPIRIFRASKPPNHVAPSVFIPLFLSFFLIAIVPHSGAWAFIPGHVVIHSLLMLPLLVPIPLSYAGRHTTIRLGALITLMTITTVLIRFRTVVVTILAISGQPPPRSLITPMTTLPSLLHALSSSTPQTTANFSITHITGPLSTVTHFLSTALANGWHTLNAHPAQSSIGWDVVWTSVSLGVWMLNGSSLGGITELGGTKVTTGGKKLIAREGMSTRMRKSMTAGRGLFAPLVGLPGLVSMLSAPWAARVGEVHVKWQAGGVLRILKTEPLGKKRV